MTVATDVLLQCSHMHILALSNSMHTSETYLRLAHSLTCGICIQSLRRAATCAADSCLTLQSKASPRQPTGALCTCQVAQLPSKANGQLMQCSLCSRPLPGSVLCIQNVVPKWQHSCSNPQVAVLCQGDHLHAGQQSVRMPNTACSEGLSLATVRYRVTRQVSKIC